ncbi:MAG: SH3 domain-containing protein, partial [Candidatus Limnocylindrales bacterium]
LLVALSATTSVARPASAAAYAPRVVIVVGPSGASTAMYLDRANLYADQARAYGAAVTEIYTPNATWARVVSASQGANVFIYLGHGNGWPSPYAPFKSSTKDGLGLNPYAGSGSASPVKYYGEDAIAAHIRLAPGAVVLLNHLCYASGNGESGAPEPTWTTARKRVDNYAAGFFRARAVAVLADGHSGLGNEIAYLFGRAQPLLGAWRADPDAGSRERSISSVRSPGLVVHIDPDNASSGFYRSLVTTSGASTRGIRVPAWRGSTTVNVMLRSGPSIGATQVTGARKGQRLFVIGPAQVDGAGRTWAPVITLKGTRGWVAGWHITFAGSAAPRMGVFMRSSPRATASRVGAIKAGTRLIVTRSTHDSNNRVWLGVRTSSGKTGWVAGWLMRP